MSDQQTIVFEMPVHALVRDSLRLEPLLSRAYDHARHATPWDIRACIQCILDLLSFLDRAELRSKYLQDFTRYYHSVSKLITHESIADPAMENLKESLSDSLSLLSASSGKFSEKLRTTPFFKTLLLNYPQPSADYNVNTPGYQLWLSQAETLCQQQLVNWLNDFNEISTIIKTQLHFIRAMGKFEQAEASNGFFQNSLHSKCLLIRLKFKTKFELFPKISVGQHGMSVQLFNANLKQTAKESCENTPFEVAYCYF